MELRLHVSWRFTFDSIFPHTSLAGIDVKSFHICVLQVDDQVQVGCGRVLLSFLSQNLD